MSDPQKTVFISYRRETSQYIARAIFLALRERGYNVFMDVESINSGRFSSIVLNQIRARAHFLLILAPGTLDRCNTPDDWLRREIEEAIETERNIVTVLANDFDFRDSTEYLTGKLSNLHEYNGPKLYHDYFDEAIDKLCNRFFKKVAKGSVIQISMDEAVEVERILKKSTRELNPTIEQLEAERYFSQANKRDKDDLTGQIADYTEALRLDPRNPRAFNSRGFAYIKLKDYLAAIEDFDQAIDLDSEYGVAYNNRGFVYNQLQNYENAVIDLTRSMMFEPELHNAPRNRGNAYFALGAYEKALADYKKANTLRPADDHILAGLAITYFAIGEILEAVRLWRRLIKLDQRYHDPLWIKEELTWTEPLVTHARKLIELFGS
jgi:tetratricopeptide (TPR) repeat protein